MSAVPDLKNRLKLVNLRGPNASTTGTTAVASAILDRAGYEAVLLVLHTGQLDDADATFAVTLEHGDDPALSDTAAPGANDLIGTLAADMNHLFSDDNKLRAIGYKGSKRYVRMTWTPSANSAAAAFGMFAILGNARTLPAA
jgi:hypothetical protein